MSMDDTGSQDRQPPGNSDGNTGDRAEAPTASWAAPPLWRRVMDPRVLAHYEGDVLRANIRPRRRRKVLARYASTGS